MTLIELQDELGKQIGLLSDDKTPFQAKKQLADVASVISSLAKQMINNADVILRTEKLAADGKLRNSAIESLISGNKSD